MKKANKTKHKTLKIGLLSFLAFSSISTGSVLSGSNTFAAPIPSKVGTEAFVMTIDTEAKYSDEKNEFTIYTNDAFYNDPGYNYQVNCDIDDESSSYSDPIVNKNKTCDYDTPGQHRIAIKGTFPHLNNYGGWSKGENTSKITAVNQWGTQKWRSMTSMFEDAINLVYVPNKPSPNLSSVKSMEDMFSDAYKFNSPIDKWDLSNVKNTFRMFADAYKFNQPLNNWNVSNVENMGAMFIQAYSFNKPIDKWDTSSVTSMDSMFWNARNFNQDISSWDVSNVTNMNLMFLNATKFNQDISSWNTTNVKNFSGMFAYQEPDQFMPREIDSNHTQNYYDKSLANLNLSSVTSIDYILAGSSLSKVNYEKTLLGWSKNPNTPDNLDLAPYGLKYCDDTGRKALLAKGWDFKIRSNDENNDDADTKECLPPTDPTISSTTFMAGSESNTVGKVSATSDSIVGINYSLVDGEGSEDNELFSIDKDGNLSFVKSPDFNNPIDKGDKEANNTYSVRVRLASNGDETKFIDKTFVIKVEKKEESKTGLVKSENSTKLNNDKHNKTDTKLASTGQDFIFYIVVVSIVIVFGVVGLVYVNKRAKK